MTILKPESPDHAIADLEPRGRNLPARVEFLRQRVPCSARYMAALGRLWFWFSQFCLLGRGTMPISAE